MDTWRCYIYNSRNYSILLNQPFFLSLYNIYNSRNYSILLNVNQKQAVIESTTVEIILYYLTPNLCICTIFGVKQLYFIIYITFAQYMLSNIDYYKLSSRFALRYDEKSFSSFWHNHILELHSLMTV